MVNDSGAVKIVDFRRAGLILVTREGIEAVEDSVVVEKRVGGSISEANELEVWTSIVGLLQKLEPVARERILQSDVTFLGINLAASASKQPPHPFYTPPNAPSQVQPSFSEDRTISPKQFMFEKQPRTDVEKVACLAYYLTHYREMPHFKTLDISKLNTEAAQTKFSNPTVAVENAVKTNYLVPATKGNKQLSALGEQFVQALPDREKARAIMANARPRRKSRKVETPTGEE